MVYPFSSWSAEPFVAFFFSVCFSRLAERPAGGVCPQELVRLDRPRPAGVLHSGTSGGTLASVGVGACDALCTCLRVRAPRPPGMWPAVPSCSGGGSGPSLRRRVFTTPPRRQSKQGGGVRPSVCRDSAASRRARRPGLDSGHVCRDWDPVRALRRDIYGARSIRLGRRARSACFAIS